MKLHRIITCWCTKCGEVWGHVQEVEKEELEKGALSPCCNAPVTQNHPDRFCYLDPQERQALRILITNHLNTISEISLHKDFRVTGYLDWLARLEEELTHGHKTLNS